MPTIIVDKAKGLFQKAGTSANPAGSFSGAKDVVRGPFEGVAAVTASLADSGKIFLLGGGGGNTCIALPEQTAANVGFNIKLVTTGALENPCVVQTIDSTGASATSDTFILSLNSLDEDASQNQITQSSNELSLSATSSGANEVAVVDITYIAANKALVFGNSKT